MLGAQPLSMLKIYKLKYKCKKLEKINQSAHTWGENQEQPPQQQSSEKTTFCI